MLRVVHECRLTGREMSVASPREDTHVAGGVLPAFVERAREDAQYRAALARAGYSRIKAAYTRQVRDGRDPATFRGLDNLAPPMDLVRDWLKAERKRVIAHVRWTFLGAMLATIVTGLAFAAAYSLLG
jgi:hypothetical protein